MEGDRIKVPFSFRIIELDIDSRLVLVEKSSPTDSTKAFYVPMSLKIFGLLQTNGFFQHSDLFLNINFSEQVLVNWGHRMTSANEFGKKVLRLNGVKIQYIGYEYYELDEEDGDPSGKILRVPLPKVDREFEIAYFTYMQHKNFEFKDLLFHYRLLRKGSEIVYYGSLAVDADSVPIPKSNFKVSEIIGGESFYLNRSNYE